MRVGLFADSHGDLDERGAAVRGNNDVAAKWPEEERPLLATIPEECRIALPGGDLVVVHGHRSNPAAMRHQRLRHRYQGARAVVVGHSHRLQCDGSGVPWLLNPGAAGRARTRGGPSCIILQATAVTWRIEMRRFAQGGEEITCHRY